MRVAIRAVDGRWNGGGDEGVGGGVRVVRRGDFVSQGHGCKSDVSVSVKARRVRE